MIEIAFSHGLKGAGSAVQLEKLLSVRGLGEDLTECYCVQSTMLHVSKSESQLCAVHFNLLLCTPETSEINTRFVVGARPSPLRSLVAWSCAHTSTNTSTEQRCDCLSASATIIER
jgi:hypothetical protein